MELEDKIILDIKNIKKHFKKLKVLKGINLKVKDGEKLAILGANGSGKTTLIEIICKIKKQNSGTIDYDFKGDSIKKSIGIQFQEGNWPDSLSAFDIIKFYKTIYLNITDKWIETLLKEFGLKDFYKRNLNNLSGGQKQRFNALLSILIKPELLILDELSNGLDIELKHRIIKFLKKWLLKTNTSLIFISHNPSEVENLCDNLAIIHEGKIYYENDIKSIIKEFGSVSNIMDIYFEGGLNGNR